MTKFASIPPTAAVCGAARRAGRHRACGARQVRLAAPGGLAFSEFRGYEDWQTVAVSHNGNMIAAILGNPAMIEAYKAGIPGTGKPFPDGAKMAKSIGTRRKLATARPSDRTGRAARRGLHGQGQQEVRGQRRMGYVVFEYDAASDTFRPGNLKDTPPQANDAKCGFACQTIAAAKDYVFTAYPKR